MPGSHRRRVAVLVAGVVVLAGAAAAAVTLTRPDRHPAAPRAERSASPTPTLMPTPTTSTPPTPTVRHDFVAPAAPTHFVLSGPKFTIKAHVCGMPNVRPLDPPGEQHHRVCWVDHDFGVAPGSRTATTYVLGHSWAEDRLEVLNKASNLATAQILRAHPRKISGIKTYPVTALDGYRLQLDTARGRLIYTVRDVYGVAKDQAGFIKPLMDERTPQRVALITCAERHGVDYDYDIIVNAYLTESISAEHLANPAIDTAKQSGRPLGSSAAVSSRR